MKKSDPPAPDQFRKPTIFCTECGAELENFCFSDRAEDLDAIRRNLARCKKRGKFTGEFCSKLYVAESGVQGLISDFDPD